ncbi:MAG: DUF3883 domain-containing protein [Candidatus Omnitrophica bacterium]|nr:DUF3883 domain-containing protein [Candidatus Omnitrophota bacterium]
MPNIVERKAIDMVMEFERQEGRNPKEIKLGGYDIKSGNRCIEVKGSSDNNIPSFIWINRTILKKLGKDVINYYIYIVYDIKRKPKLLILPSDLIFSNLEIDPFLLLYPNRIKKSNTELKIIDI